MGVHFFCEWVAAVVGKHDDDTGTTTTSTNAEVVPTSSSRGATPSFKKRQKTNSSSATGVDNSTLPLGSLSLHNYSAGSIRTFRSMERANVGQ